MTGRTLTTLALAAALGGAGAASDQTPKTVTTHVTITNHDGTPIQGLQPQDVRVLVDGRGQAVASLAPSGALAVVVLVDMTTSVVTRWTWRKDEYVSAVERSLIARLRPGDRAQVGGIGSKLVIPPQFSADAELLKQALRRAVNRTDSEMQGPSPIWDAVWQVTGGLAKEPGRRAVILITDGRSTSNIRGFEEIVAQANREDVAISAIGENAKLSSVGGFDPDVDPDRYLKDLARRTGGRYVENLPFTVTGRSRELLGQLVSALQQSYAVTFEVPADGRPHDLQVLVPNRDATVGVKAVFYANAGG